MDLIVNVSKDWAIGKGNSLLFHLSQDMKFFKENTTGKTVIMGRKTLDSLPGGKPLPNRTNIVLTRNCDFARDGVTVYNTVEDMLDALADTPSDELVVMGGESIYRTLLPYCTRALVTKVDAAVDDADVFMVNLDDDPQWEVVSESPTMNEKGFDFKFVTYKRK